MKRLMSMQISIGRRISSIKRSQIHIGIINKKIMTIWPISVSDLIILTPEKNEENHAISEK